MAVRFPRYRMIDGKAGTSLSAGYFNPIWTDLDSRLDKLEQLSVSWSSAVAELQSFGLARIDAAIVPVLQAAQADVLALQDAVDGIQEQIDAVGLQAQIDEALTAYDTAITAQLEAQDEEIAGQLSTQNTAVSALVTASNAVLADAQEALTDLGGQVADLSDAVDDLEALVTAPTPDASITFAKIQNVSANVLLGRTTGSGVIQEVPCTAAGRTFLTHADAAAQRRALGLPLAQTLHMQPATPASINTGADTRTRYNGITTAFFHRMEVAQEILVGKISIRSGATPATAGAVRIGLYTASGTRLFAVDSPSITDSSSVYTVSVTPVLLLPGSYYVGVVALSSADVYIAGWQASPLDAPAGAPIFNGSVTVSGSTLPTTINPLTLTTSSKLAPVVRLDT